MDEKDKDILNLLQNKFPLDPKPFKILGDKIWLDEVSVISRTARMVQNGVIRHLGAFFDSRKLGYEGALAAANVPDQDIEKVAKIINDFEQVTHNYLRDGNPNMWFTVIAKNNEERQKIIDEIKQKSGLYEILVFPSKKLFKVKAVVD